MDCPNRNTDLISAYVDGMATSTEKIALEKHMSECSACAREVRELVRTRDFVRGLPTLTPSPRLMPSISQKLREQKVGWLQRLFWTGGPANLRASVALAACLVVCATLGVVAVNHTGTVDAHSVVELPEASAPMAPIEHHDVYEPPATTLVDLPVDAYEGSCALTHAAYDRDETVWAVDSVMLASH
ncbi:MAG TPA: zf-HC2 domain-containing protein [Armatimonadota bacterium]|nr:zf-HC2 domain-containing protein [Armatimonadota bacterium]